MAITLINSANSFVKFNEDIPEPLCGWEVDYCLPVYEAADVNFQVIASGTEDEIADLCRTGATEIEVSLVSECEGAPLISFTEKPERFRLSSTQVLYNWSHGFPGFPAGIAVKQCFKIQVTLLLGAYLTPSNFCSNCFERISDPCYTSVLEFGNEEDAFGFKYCYAGAVDTADITCEPTVIEFINKATLALPYTAAMRAKYGDIPVIQTWIYDPSGVLTNMGIQATFNQYPPTIINFDFGGPATGILVIR